MNKKVVFFRIFFLIFLGAGLLFFNIYMAPSQEITPENKTSQKRRQQPKLKPKDFPPIPLKRVNYTNFTSNPQNNEPLDKNVVFLEPVPKEAYHEPGVIEASIIYTFSGRKCILGWLRDAVRRLFILLIYPIFSKLASLIQPHFVYILRTIAEYPVFRRLSRVLTHRFFSEKYTKPAQPPLHNPEGDDPSNNNNNNLLGPAQCLALNHEAVAPKLQLQTLITALGARGVPTQGLLNLVEAWDDQTEQVIPRIGDGTTEEDLAVMIKLKTQLTNDQIYEIIDATAPYNNLASHVKINNHAVKINNKKGTRFKNASGKLKKLVSSFRKAEVPLSELEQLVRDVDSNAQNLVRKAPITETHITQLKKIHAAGIPSGAIFAKIKRHPHYNKAGNSTDLKKRRPYKQESEPLQISQQSIPAKIMQYLI
jgi:hypothetical protein